MTEATIVASAAPAAPTAPAAPAAASPALPAVPAAAGMDRPAGVAAVAENVASLMRDFAKAKARMLQDAQRDAEWAAHVLLRSLATNGPMRVSSLAECVQSDLSTISRQVASLVKDGLLERRADPADGRVSLLVPTEAGRAVIAEHDLARMAFFDRMLSDWNVEDLQQFARLLDRFGADYSRAKITWNSERAAPGSRHSGGNTR